MKKTNKTYYLFEMNPIILNTVSFGILIIMLIITLFVHMNISDMFVGKSMGIILILSIPYLILHELLHSLAYVIHGAKFNRITYGIHLEKGILCCLCKCNVSKRCILTSLLYPFIFIGIITYIIGIIINSEILVILSLINISGCSGDLVMFYDLVRLKDFEFSEYDNPLAFGLYSNEDLSKKKLFGLKYIESKDTLEQNDLKKLAISKKSIYIFIGIIILVGIEFLIS